MTDSCTPANNCLLSVNTIGEILNRKRSVVQIMTKTAEGLSEAFEFRKASPEDLVFDLFKLPQKDDASIGKLISVRNICVH